MRFKEFKLNPLTEAILDEVSMHPTSLQRWAEGPDAEGMLMGIEFEMCIPGDGFIRDRIDDLSMDEEVGDIEEILDFFEDNPYIDDDYVRADVEQDLMDRYRDWYFDKINEYIDENPGQLSMYLFSAVNDLIGLDDSIDRALEKLGDDAQDSDVHDLAVKLQRDRIDTIIDDETEVYDEALDNARAKIEEEMYNDDLLSERSWLSDIGIEYMSDAIPLHDALNWPYVRDDELLEEIGDDFSAKIGKPVDVNTDYHGSERNSRKWIIEPDSSIKPFSRDDTGLEFISPTQSISETLRQMSELIEWAKEKKCYTNESTGLHINISVPNFSIEKLDYIKLALFMGDTYILTKFDRLTNTYCRSATNIIKNLTDAATAKQVLEKMRKHLTTSASKLIHDGLTAKHTSINTHEGDNAYVEFRGPGGDYLNKPVGELVNTALRLAMALNIACDEQAYKEEYGKKLYRLISDTTPMGNHYDNSIDLFIDYAAGTLTSADLKSFITQRQTRRDYEKQRSVNNTPKLPADVISPTTQRWTITNILSGQSSTIEAEDENSARRIAIDMTGLQPNQFIIKKATV